MSGYQVTKKTLLVDPRDGKPWTEARAQSYADEELDKLMHGEPNVFTQDEPEEKPPSLTA